MVSNGFQQTASIQVLFIEENANLCGLLALLRAVPPSTDLCPLWFGIFWFPMVYNHYYSLQFVVDSPTCTYNIILFKHQDIQMLVY